MYNPHEPIRVIEIPELYEPQPKVEALIDEDNPVFSSDNNENFLTIDIDAELSYFTVHGKVSPDYIPEDTLLVEIIFCIAATISMYFIVGALL
jgi:hypothetical protein